MNKIKLIHGEGGQATTNLINDIFYENYGNEYLNCRNDSATLIVSPKIAFTTDSFVIKPIFFKGGNIGSLAVNGTVNDLVVSGAIPKYLSCSLIIEEGFSIDKLKEIARAIRDTCNESGVNVVTGDTKVVAKGEADGLFINTAGIGEVIGNYYPKELTEGDVIIVTGTIAEHGTVILNERYQLNVNGDLFSDCAPLTPYLDVIKPYLHHIKLMKDPTRGGIATILNEISSYNHFDIEVIEENIPIRKAVLAVNELLGIDPLYVACEGRMIIIVEKEKANLLLEDVKNINKDAQIIGEIKEKKINSHVYMQTKIGGKRLIAPLDYSILPRIC